MVPGEVDLLGTCDFQCGVITGVGVADDAGRRVRREDPLQTPFGLRRAVGDDNLGRTYG